VSEVAVQGGRQVTLRQEIYRNLTFRPGATNNAIEVVNDGSKLIQLDRGGMAAFPTPWVAVLPAVTGTVGTNLPSAPAIPAKTFRAGRDEIAATAAAEVTNFLRDISID